MSVAMQVFYRNREAVINAGRGGSTKAAWDELLISCPEISQTMPYNTFKTYLHSFTVLMELVQADMVKNQEVKNMEESEQPIPKTYQGWTVQRSKKDGFIRLYKSLSGKVKCLYIGRLWDGSKALNKINAVTVGGAGG
jgi:hypothetical protein